MRHRGQQGGNPMCRRTAVEQPWRATVVGDCKWLSRRTAVEQPWRANSIEYGCWSKSQNAHDLRLQSGAFVLALILRCLQARSAAAQKVGVGAPPRHERESQSELRRGSPRGFQTDNAKRSKTPTNAVCGKNASTINTTEKICCTFRSLALQVELTH